MMEYFYTGKLTVESSDILEMLEMCQEYLIPDMKQLIEQIIIKNLDIENFSDSMQIARSFDCKILREAIYLFAKKNYQTLYR